MSTVRLWFTTHGALEGKPWTIAFEGTRLNVARVVFEVPTSTVFKRTPEWRAIFPEGLIEAVGVVTIEPLSSTATVKRSPK